MLHVDVKKASARLPRLIELVATGEEVVIERSGVPVARLTGLPTRRSKRRLGHLDGQFRIPDDFNRPLPHKTARAFEGR